MMYKVFHGSTYTYSGPVESSRHLLHLLPRDHQTQKCLLSSVEVSPRPATNSESLDAFQNRVTFLDVEGPYDQMIITALSEVVVEAPPVLNLSDCPSWEYVSNLFGDLTDNEIREAHQFTRSSPYIMDLESVREFSTSSFPSGRPILDAVMDLTSRIFSTFTYEGGVTDISTPISNVMQSRKGVCQDFAHLQIACLRALGLPARYVSGYLLTHPPEGQRKLIGADESHAWIAVWCPEIGWVDFNATNNLIPTDEHITVGWGRDYGDVSPIMGTMVGGGDHELFVSVDVEPLDKA